MTTLKIPMGQLRSATPGLVPDPIKLIPGQLMINTADKRLFIKDDAGSIQQIGVATGDLDLVAFSGSWNDLKDKPNIQAEYVLPKASPTVLGGVVVGAGLAADVNGVLSNTGVISVNTRTGSVTLSKTDVGLPADFVDANSKVLVQYLPDSVTSGIQYQTTYNAATNTPSIPAASGGNKSWLYIVSAAGTATIPGQSGIVVGISDWLLSNGTTWERVPGSGNNVVNVNGQTGEVVINAANLPNLSEVGKTGQYADLLGIPTSFTPAAHQHVANDITDIALVAKTNDYNDLDNLPQDPTIANIGISADGDPALLKEVQYVFTRRCLFGQDWAPSKCFVTLTEGSTTGTIRILKNGTQVGTITTSTSTGTFTSVGSATQFEAGDRLGYQWQSANIVTASINLQGNWN